MLLNSLSFVVILFVINSIQFSHSIYSQETRLKIINQSTEQKRQQKHQEAQQQQHALTQKTSYDKYDDVVVKSYDTNEVEFNDEKTGTITTTRHKRELSDYLIAPNTAWCGRGNIANGTYNHLGGASKADKCCRKHDHCEKFIPGMDRQYDFFNLRPYTLSHCKCDRSFRTCLKMANDKDANAIGKMYFNLIQKQCFVLRNETVCKKRSGDNTCKEMQVKTKAVLKRNKRY